ncbi:MAG: hypothetical protein U5L45_23440 [Saprospiraceae bacterium]|nr:hypothetical protein [Saprospiraceae bacterium]
MVHFSGFARKTNHIPFFASEASYGLSNYKNCSLSFYRNYLLSKKPFVQRAKGFLLRGILSERFN